MKKIIGSGILLLILSVCTNAQNKNAVAYKSNGTLSFSGHVTGRSTLKDSIYIYFMSDFLKNITRMDAETLKVPVNAKGDFVFKLTGVSQPGNIGIYYMGDSNAPLGDYIVEPGDNISMSVILKEPQPKVIFSGQGADKYQARQKIEIERNRFNDRRDSLFTLSPGHAKIESLFPLHQSAINSMNAALEKYKNKIRPEIYLLMKGEFLTYPSRVWYLTVVSKIDKKDTTRKALFLKYIDDLSITANAEELQTLAQSNNYVLSVLEKEKMKLIILANGGQADFKTMYERLKNGYSGIFREHLLADHLLQTYNQSGLDFSEPLDYENCLKDAYSLINTPAIKDLIGQSIRLYSKGAEVYNFSLPDTSGKMRSLSEFKGKVVMLDMWNTGCTGCAIFADYFKRKIYPEFKDNPDFKVISINMDNNRDQWMKSLYSEKYTEPWHVNLNDGNEKKDSLVDYYSIVAYPFLMLIDKEGKVFAPVTIHTMTKLNSLIRDALNSN